MNQAYGSLTNCFVVSIFAVAAATGYSSHRLDFVSESYGGSKPNGCTPTSEEASKKKKSNESLWDVVREETISQLNTIRVKSVFEDENEIDGTDVVLLKEYKSQRELMKDYESESERWGSSVQVGSKGVGLRHRSSV